MKKKSVKKSAPTKLAPCTCEFDKGIVAMFEESLKKLQSLGPEPMEHWNLALNHSDGFNHMMHCLCQEDTDAGYIMSDMFRLGHEAGRRTAECQALEKMVGI